MLNYWLGLKDMKSGLGDFYSVVIFIITAVSNGEFNLTDGIDGLAAGTSAYLF
jgi:UDP-N-acetylmuramyl pentapeptide phosphotransferase/UDP-N-acetylglucosamine-1-phosphate transferase